MFPGSGVHESHVLVVKVSCARIYLYPDCGCCCVGVLVYP
jgi:hypothetical protein